jgi:hypothetical protein
MKTGAKLPIFPNKKEGEKLGQIQEEIEKIRRIEEWWNKKGQEKLDNEIAFKKRGREYD